MKKVMRRLKVNFSSVLIIIGGIIILVSAGKLYSYKHYQEAIQDIEIPVLLERERTDDDIDIDVTRRNKVSRVSVKPLKENFQRSNYKDGLMKIEIPTIGVNASVIDGTTTAKLKKGPALYEISPLPDVPEGNVCIAGHRTTYGAWFRKLNDLKEKDEIILEFNNEKYVYLVEKVFIVASNDWSVTKSIGYNAVTLTACHPLGSSKQRIVVRGKLKE
jgi:sortase A